ncbi:MAG: flavodoxin family protein [Sphaerochaeta sp.]
MNTLAVVFYSLEGHTKYLAEHLAQRLDADLFQIHPKKPYPTKGFAKFFCAGRDASLRRTIALQRPLPDFADYSVVLLCTPIWAETTSAPVYSFLTQTNLSSKRLFFIATCSGGPAKRCFQRMRKAASKGATVLGEERFVHPSDETRTRDEAQIASICSLVNEYSEERIR